MDEINFLSFDDLLEIHSRQLALYGGGEGFIDRNVVESALAQPQASMFGRYLHEDVAVMAAAYLFHFAAAQGFVDGNKRTAAGCATIFLARNGYDLDCTADELYELTMNVANNRMRKEEAGEWIRERVVPET
jgi:death-on-curing protein